MKKILVSCFLFLVFFAFNAYASSTPVITLDDYRLSVGESTTVTFTFSEQPISFVVDDIVAENGVISNFTVTGSPLVYTATFTPTSEVNYTTNAITIAAKDTVKIFTGLPSAPRTDLAFDGVDMWVTSYYTEDSVSKVAPDGTVTTYTGTGSWPKGIAFDGTNMWTANYLTNNVSKITPGGVITNYSVPGNPDGIAFDGVNMWTANYSGQSVSKITPAGSVTTYPGQADSWPWDIAFDGTNMWTVNYYGSVTKYTPSGTATTYGGIGNWATGITFDGTNMWTVSNYENQVAKVDPSGNVTTYSTGSGLGAGGYGLVFSDGYLWVADQIAQRIIKINPSGVIVKTYSLGFSPYNIISDGTSIWTSNSNGSISRLGDSLSVSSANYEINTIAPRNSSTHSITHYGCKDTSALNYEYFSAHKPSLCVYGSKSVVVEPPVVNTNDLNTKTVIPSTLKKIDIPKIQKNLKFGSNDSEVKMLQEFLISANAGVDSTKLKNHGSTHQFGSLTKLALSEWQKANGLKADGILGLKTRGAINSLLK
jgi:hypothetical protein